MPWSVETAQLETAPTNLECLINSKMYLGLTQLDTVTIFTFHRPGIGQVQDLPLLGLFPVGATLVVALDAEVRDS